MKKTNFDRISSDYDFLVEEIDKQNLFPYAGYQNLIDYVAKIIADNPIDTVVKIVDLGIGSANLYQLLDPETFRLYGIDKDETMLEKAKSKLPQASYYLHDFNLGLPEAIKKERFDYIVSTYSMCHLSTKELAMQIDYLMAYLEPFGKIIIAGNIFENHVQKNLVYHQNHQGWNKDETYHCFDDILALAPKDFALSFIKINNYAGILIVERYQRKTLQMEKAVIEYKSTTMKWKSNQKEETSE